MVSHRLSTDYPWIIQGCQSHSDTGVGGRAVIGGLSRDARVTLTSADTLTQGLGGRTVIRGVYRDVRVTLTSMDTLTQGWGGRAVILELYRMSELL